MRRINYIDKKNIIDEIIREIQKYPSLDRVKLEEIKRKIAKKYGIGFVPRNYEIIRELRGKLRDKIKSISAKPVRSISGIVIVSVFTEPSPCPGRCIYCPGGVDNPTPSPKSYSGHEPAARRASQLNYDPYLQVTRRLDHLSRLGHPIDKVSLIVMGGTFIYLDKEYRDYFMKGVYEGILGKKFPGERIEILQKRLEKSRIRLVELTFETRPDYCMEKHVDEMLYYGATRVEIGVQTLRDEILRFVRRGHDVETTRRAFRIARDAGLKIVAHMMPNLPPNPDVDRDYEDFLNLFEDPDFRPDMLKIYPTAVVKGTYLYRMWLRGEYKPYDEDKLIALLARVKKMLPPWVRIQRLQRDIPTYLVEAGYKSGNLRQLVLNYMKKRGWRCRCIRCREIGHKVMKEDIDIRSINPKLVRRKYKASDGIEIFLSFEDVERDIIIGLLRLRKPSDKAHRPEVNSNTMIIRELHVYGPLVPLGKKFDQAFQHRGYGARLLAEAEKISSEEFDARKILIISGIGVREYYRRFGYRLEGPYMAKHI